MPSSVPDMPKAGSIISAEWRSARPDAIRVLIRGPVELDDSPPPRLELPERLGPRVTALSRHGMI